LNFSGGRDILPDQTQATSWGRVDHDNKVVHITTPNGGSLKPPERYRGKELENDVFNRLAAVKHLKKQFPDYKVHYAGPMYSETKPQVHSYSEHEKFLTDLLK
jgi:hypothetical protein